MQDERFPVRQVSATEILAQMYPGVPVEAARRLLYKQNRDVRRANFWRRVRRTFHFWRYGW